MSVASDVIKQLLEGKAPNDLIPVSQGGKMPPEKQGYNRKTVYKYYKLFSRIKALNLAFNDLMLELVDVKADVELIKTIFNKSKGGD